MKTEKHEMNIHVFGYYRSCLVSESFMIHPKRQVQVTKRVLAL